MPATDSLAAALADRYVIERLIGEGGMAKVYLARDLRHNRRVALKVLRSDLGAVVGVERFLAEIQVTSNLQHPNLLPLFDSGAAGDTLFYVMPYVPGESLRARLDREKQLPVDEAVRIATAIAGALDYAHRQGVIHRDLKPENVLLQEGQPLVADFGIALAVANAGGARITQTGLSLGTPQYMSPEQATGDRVIDSRTDVYSLGALCYEMLTGEPPHVGTTSQAIIARVLTERPRPIRTTRPSVPEYVEATVDRALEKLPADRWGTARDFADALSGARPVVRNTAAAASLTTGVVASRTTTRRELIAWSAAAVSVVALGLIAMRPSHSDVSATPVELELTLPDSFDTSRNGFSLSEDGKTLVFGAAVGKGEQRLYVRRLDDRLIQEIRGSEDAASPVLSPDGSEVLFISSSAVGNVGTIKRLPVRGGAARTLLDRAAYNVQVSWHESGRIIAATTEGLMLVDSRDGSKTLLAAPDSARHYMRYGWPNILPDGKAALITIWRGGTALDSTVLGLVTVPDGKVTELGIRGTFPRYSRSGHLLYTAARDPGLLAVRFDAASRRVTGTPTIVVEGLHPYGGGAAPFEVASTGSLIFIQNASDASGRGVLPVAVDRAGHQRSLGAKRGNYRNPRISPDGRQIAFSVFDQSTGGSPDIWRFVIGTSDLQRVTTNRASDRPSWSREGDQIIYSSEPRDSVLLSIALSAGAQPTPVLHVSGQVVSSDIGPAHGYSAFAVTGRNVSDIWVVHMDSLSHPRPFLTEPYTEGHPRVSPDGKALAYQTDRTGRLEVYIREISGRSEEVKVSAEGGIDAAWSPDGTELFYRTKDSLMVARISRTPRLAVNGRHGLFSLTGYAGTPNRAMYDVFPSAKEFVMLASADTIPRRQSMVVRTNWAAGLPTETKKR